MNPRIIRTILPLAVLLPGDRASSQGMPRLDQYYTPIAPLNGLEVTVNQSVAQTFRVELAGVLSRANVVVG